MLHSPTQIVNPFARRVIGYGTGASGGGDPNAAPTLAPTLAVDVDGMSTPYVANLTWTYGGSTAGAGFGFRIWRGEPSAPDPDTDMVFATVVGAVFLYDDDVGASPGNYHYIIRAFNDSGEGPSSNTVNVNLPGESEGPVLLGPDNTTGSQIVTDDFTLTWSAIPGAATYDVYASLTDSSYTLWDGDVAATSLAVSLAAAFGNANWWYVIAHNGSGIYSAESNHLECAPTLPSGTARNCEDTTGRSCEDDTARILES